MMLYVEHLVERCNAESLSSIVTALPLLMYAIVVKLKQLVLTLTEDTSPEKQSGYESVDL
jgi:hypothetical protein